MVMQGYRPVSKILSILIVFALFNTPRAYGADPEQNRNRVLAKPASNFDRAIGFMDAGRMKVSGVENFGLLSGWDPPNTDWYPGAIHGKWGEIRWIAPVLAIPPGPWGAGVLTQDGVVEDRSNQYNVIESFSAVHLYDGDGITFSDWEAKDGSQEHIHGTVTEEGIPMIAVSTMEQSWPAGYYDSTGTWVSTPDETHWPGKWALDPDPDSPTYNEPLPGTFVSDKDLFFIMDDKYNGIRSGASTARYGYPLGLDVEVSGYTYSSVWYEDIVFFNMNVIYRTADELNNPQSPNYDPDRRHYDGVIDSAYFAFFVDPDLPGAFLENSLQANPWAEDDYASIEDIDGDGRMDICLMYDKQDYFTDYSNGNEGPVSAYGIHFFKTPRQVLNDPTSPEVGITGFHWFDQDDVMRSHTINEDWEKVLYTLCSGESELLPEEERNKWFHDLDGDNIDELETLKEFQESFPVNSRPDIQFWFSSGPFKLSPGDTIPIHIGIVGGRPEPGGYDNQGFPTNDPPQRFKDIYDNLFAASALYQSNFIGAKPPKTPELSAAGTITTDVDGVPLYYGEDEQVTLFWGQESEASIDLISKRKDFEGYRIYRSVVDYSNQGDQIWGDEIVNYYGDLVGFKPIAQFDLQNDWSGFDPYNANFNLGNNSGLQYSWTDNEVVNGLRYRYAITAYDQPFDSLHIGSNESFIGSDSRDVNIIDIIPGGQPHGFTQAELEVTRLAGDGTGEVEVLVVDPISMHADVYELGFIDTLANLVFNLDGASKGRVISLLEPEASSADLTERHYLPTDNGFLISVRNHDKVNFLSKVWQTNESGSSYSFSDLSQPTGVSEERPGRYIVLFGDSTYKYPTSFVPGAAKVPFQIFNDIDDPDWQSPLILAVGTSFNAELPWQSGEVIQMLEGSGKKTWYFTVSWDSNDIEPAAGDIFQMNTSVPFNSEDIFRIEAFESEIADVNTDLNVKVVPNPYVIHSLTERRHPDALTTHDLRFINLPAHCDIYIHTINGDLVASLRHDSETVGEYHWNMLNQDRMEIAYGMYIYAIVPDTGKKQLGKFAVIW
ncbi:MAG: hypothetical protein HOB84_12915 [Candidatus Marinimicrobia bacterium]|jgi:hypothetical protein|nr:hypothetical protein [Candidatus Neomarinimicrobiota bacterium]MBT4033574.1 hypothetical protein [Candidatus Neomarinimicrobiota bacterium]MBT4359925.1 hypothetical protein [Candidatus Neomarinimicrobiota bacterium]MBT4715664.1 hypothetical protein [Candidatus Neomarinimicrobiota bacterium]MBT4945450.1 hypothetical protein [Candidatus Neomarinimicrobiota bacterium]